MSDKTFCRGSYSNDISFPEPATRISSSETSRRFGKLWPKFWVIPTVRHHKIKHKHELKCANYPRACSCQGICWKDCGIGADSKSTLNLRVRDDEHGARANWSTAGFTERFTSFYALPTVTTPLNYGFKVLQHQTPFWLIEPTKVKAQGVV